MSQIIKRKREKEMSNEKKVEVYGKKMNITSETTAPPTYINGRCYNLNTYEGIMAFTNERLKMYGINPDENDKE